MITEYFNEAGYLLVKFKPDIPWTTEFAEQGIDEAKNEAEKRKHGRLLFDLMSWDKPSSEMTRYDSGRYVAKVFGSRFKVAALARAELINRFAERTAVHGGAWFRVFSDKAEAVEWLMDGAPPATAV